MSKQPVLTLDTVGSRCPVPIIELARHINEVPIGAVVAVISDDVAARIDIQAWCRMREQRYVGECSADVGVTYLVERTN